MANLSQSQETIEQVTIMANLITVENGFELYDVEFLREGSQWYLRIYIDKPEGITINDCELVSRSLEKKLDEKDFIAQAYMLEVSSPGMNRRLRKEKDFLTYMGEPVDVKLYKPKDGQKEYQGILAEYKDGNFDIKDESDKIFSFKEEEVASVRLSVIF